MRCPHCQHETRERARFCGTCGASLDRMVACPRCAALQPQGKRFCDSCGEALSLDGRITDLRGHKIGIVKGTASGTGNLHLLETILAQYDVAPDMVEPVNLRLQRATDPLDYSDPKRRISAKAVTGTVP